MKIKTWEKRCQFLLYETISSPENWDFESYVPQQQKIIFLQQLQLDILNLLNNRIITWNLSTPPSPSESKYFSTCCFEKPLENKNNCVSKCYFECIYFLCQITTFFKFFFSYFHFFNFSFFFLFCRDHHLQSWFRLLHESNVTNQMYEQNSFFRDGTLLNFLIEVLEALREFNVTLDKSITRGI